MNPPTPCTRPLTRADAHGTTPTPPPSRALHVAHLLPGALRRGEIYPVFQPLFDLGRASVVGFEVLARWRCADLGAVSPVEFIPIAEDTGEIVPIGRWMLRAALSAVAQLRTMPGMAKVHVAVNVAPSQISDPDLVATVRDALHTHGLPGSALWLEVTESDLPMSAEVALPVLNELKDLGVTLVLDDFGMGHSSMARLAAFPVDVLKIDRSFTADATTPRTATIISAMVALAHTLGMRVVAEGVETLEQMCTLDALGADVMQGYLLGAPQALPGVLSDAAMHDREALLSFS